MTTSTLPQTPSTRPRLTARALLGGIASAAAIVVLGPAAVPASAVEAGVVTVGTRPVAATTAMPVRSAASPSAVQTTGTTTRSYVVREDGSLVAR